MYASEYTALHSSMYIIDSIIDLAFKIDLLVKTKTLLDLLSRFRMTE